MNDSERDAQGQQNRPVDDGGAADHDHSPTRNAGVRGGHVGVHGGHADPGTTHGQAMPVEDGHVVDPLAASGHDGHDAHAGHEHAGHGHGGHGDHVAMFRRLFWIMLVLSVPTVLLSGMFASLVGYSIPDLPGLEWVSPILGTVIYLWGGRPFLTGAAGEIRARKPGMML